MKKQFLAFAPALLMAAVFTMSSCEKEEDKNLRKRISYTCIS
jgi:hypothetical protein